MAGQRTLLLLALCTICICECASPQRKKPYQSKRCWHNGKLYVEGEVGDISVDQCVRLRCFRKGRRMVMKLELIKDCTCGIEDESQSCKGAGGTCLPRYGDVYCDGRIDRNKKCNNKMDLCCIDECSMGTLPPCEALEGTCVSQDSTCDGREVTHMAFCKNSDTCKCCFPKKPCNCLVKTLAPCEALKGTCISQDATCDGRVVSHKTFCNSSNDCKCCFPEEPCNCDNNRKCERPAAEEKGYYTTGLCRQTCQSEEKPYDKCDIDNQDSCMCCLKKKEVQECGPACVSPTPSMCMCMINNKPCPNGYCSYDSDLCDDDHCTCCKDNFKTECESVKAQCSALGDYCVEKFTGDCPKGFDKINNACRKRPIADELSMKKSSNSSYQSLTLVNDCDCCKKLACEPRECEYKDIKGRCSRVDVPGAISVGEQQCKDGCNCLIKTPPPVCDPRECEYKGRKGNCSRVHIPGYFPVGVQQCRDGCECYIGPPPPACDPRECEYNGTEGLCSREDVPGFFQVGQQQCRDGCTCYIGPPPPSCDPRECKYKDRLGRCSDEDVPGSVPVGEQQCKHGCKCYIESPPPGCDPQECKYKGQPGRCSREGIPGSAPVGEQQCRDGCECYIEISPTGCEPPECSYKDRMGNCSREDVPGSVPVGEQQCRDGCKCFIEKPHPACEPKTCEYKNKTGICSLEDVPGSVPVGEQQCRDGCKCYIEKPTQACDPQECEYKNTKGECSREDIPGSVPVGEQQCRDGCECYLKKPPPACDPRECVFKGRKGICSIVNVTGSIPVGMQQCKDNCKCYIELSPPACDPWVCEYEGRKGSCSRKDVPGSVSVGEQQCREGCKCYIERPTECISKHKKCTAPDYCEDKTVSCRKGYAKIFDTCFKSLFKPWPVSVNCDCCKSLECSPIGDRCSGKGNYCIDRNEVCPRGFTESLDCYKPVIVNGELVKSQLCKCCKPIIIGNDCDNNRKCERPAAEEEGYYPTGHCRQTCRSDEGPYDKCDDDNSDSCLCCLRKKEVPDCGPACVSATPSLCMCMINNKPCPNGYCSYDNGLCDDDHCTCCKDDPKTECESVKNQCSAPEDYCVDKFTGKCPNGFGRVINACHKKFIGNDFPIEKESNSSSTNLTLVNDCDCCKKLGCASNGDACSGHGSYCIEPTKSCPPDYETTKDCSKPVIVNGVFMQSQLCKCCKERPMNCDNNRKCERLAAEDVGYYPTGHCRMTCHSTEKPYDKCDIENQDSCMCCLRKKEVQDCGPTCASPTPSLCMCMINNKPCPNGYCSYDSDLCDDDHCTCCKDDSKTECESVNNQCSAPGDYCVEKFTGDCPKGFGKINNACRKKLIANELSIEKSSNSSSQNLTLKNDCDCCKKLGCISNGDACTGKGSYCIETKAACPIGYVTTNDCSKPVVVNGVYTESQLCNCCKPRKIIASGELEEVVAVDLG